MVPHRLMLTAFCALGLFWMAVPSIHSVFIRTASEGDDNSSIRGSHIFMLVMPTEVHQDSYILEHDGPTVCIINLLNELGSRCQYTIKGDLVT